MCYLRVIKGDGEREKGKGTKRCRRKSATRTNPRLNTTACSHACPSVMREFTLLQNIRGQHPKSLFHTRRMHTERSRLCQHCHFVLLLVVYSVKHSYVLNCGTVANRAQIELHCGEFNIRLSRARGACDDGFFLAEGGKRDLSSPPSSRDHGIIHYRDTD